jgi:ferredoxin
MRIVVDHNQCESNALCVGAAPEVFELDADDRLRLLVERPSPELRTRVEDAVRLCPKQALSIVEDRPIVED